MPAPQIPGAVGGSHHALIRAGACHLLSLGTNPYSRSGAARPFLGQGVKRDKSPPCVSLPLSASSSRVTVPLTLSLQRKTPLLVAHRVKEEGPVQAMGGGPESLSPGERLPSSRGARS